MLNNVQRGGRCALDLGEITPPRDLSAWRRRLWEQPARCAAAPVGRSVFSAPAPLPGDLWPKELRRRTLREQADASLRALGGLRVPDVLAAVAVEFGVTVGDILARSHRPLFTLPRHVAMYLARALTGLSYPHIAARMDGRDHTTIVHGVQAMARRMAADRALRERVEALAARLRADGGANVGA